MVGEESACAPTYITDAPTRPISVVAERLISEMAVSDADDVIEQALHAAREDFRFGRLGVVALHHANAGQRFGEPALYLGVDFPALAENRPDASKGLAQANAEDAYEQ